MNNIKGFDSFNEKKEVNKKELITEENHEEGTQNYMFFGNLKTIKRLVDTMLEMDESEVDNILTNGHNWAVDHIATSKDDVEEVFNFLAGVMDIDTFETEEEKPLLLGGPESSHTVHDNHMRDMTKEDENIKGFEDFQ